MSQHVKCAEIHPVARVPRLIAHHVQMQTLQVSTFGKGCRVAHIEMPETDAMVYPVLEDDAIHVEERPVQLIKDMAFFCFPRSLEIFGLRHVMGKT